MKECLEEKKFSRSLQTMLFRPCRALSTVQNFRSFPPNNSSASCINNNIIPHVKSPFPQCSQSFPRLCLSSLSEGPRNVSLVSVLQHPEYEEMKRKLEHDAQSALDIACLYILERKIFCYLKPFCINMFYIAAKS